jgi:hypothetical protein
VRLNRSINGVPLSPNQKRQWAAQLADLFVQGQDFAVQMSRRSMARPTQTSANIVPNQVKGEN